MNKFKQEDPDTWLILSDVSLGGFIIFLIIAVVYMNREDKEAKIQRLMDSLKPRIENEVVRVDPSGRVRFSFKDQNKQLFEVGDNRLTKDFKKELDAFLPIYFDSLLNYQDKDSFYISEIRIEGHTDTTCADRRAADCYNSNLVLSQQRALSVLQYIFQNEPYTSFSPERKVALQKLMVAAGFSFSRPIHKEDRLWKEYEPRQGIDNDLSRRVEFRVMLEAPAYKKQDD